MKYVIIGNSAAAIGTVQGIREVDKEGEITLISDEKYHTYSRPLISYWLKGDVTEENMLYRPEGFYDDNNVNAVLGKRVTAIDTEKKAVILGDNTAIQYDRLMCGTGSKPFVPDFRGIDKVSRKFTFMKLDDVHAIKKELNPNTKVLIIGAGLIGLKAAEAVAKFTENITVADMSQRILPSILDEETARIMQSHIEAHGVRFALGTTVQEFSEKSAVLTNGATVEYDIVIIAVGVRPNTELIEAAGGNVGKGIITDDHQAVSGLSDIYAAGDCTESHDITTDSERIIAILPNAFMQGVVAGRNMSGGEARYEKAFAMNAIGFFGLHIITAGVYSGDVYSETCESGCKKLFTDNDRLKGFILMGDKISCAGIYTSLVREQTPLSEVDFGLIRNKPEMMGFPVEYRKEKLGGQLNGQN